MSTIFERRERILENLSSKRHVTIKELMNELHVSRNTIKNDIIELSCQFPIYTEKGRN